MTHIQECGQEHQLDDLLESARMNAATDAQEEFVARCLAHRARFGLSWQPSEHVVKYLQRIAGEYFHELRF